MPARSTGIYPREGFSLDNAFQVPSTTPVEAPINMRNCRTLRVVAVNPVVTGDALLTILIGGKGEAFSAAGLAANVDPNGVLIYHVRGYSLTTNEVSYIPLENSGTVSVDGVFVELVDGPAH